MLTQNTILFINTCSVAHHLYADQSLRFSWMYFIELKTWTITIYVHIFHCNYFKCKLRSSNLTGIWNMSLSFLCFCHLESTNLLSYSMGDFNHKHLRVAYNEKEAFKYLNDADLKTIFFISQESSWTSRCFDFIRCCSVSQCTSLSHCAFESINQFLGVGLDVCTLSQAHPPHHLKCKLSSLYSESRMY